ncbi:hypothetical protein GN956_G9565 [Arapaima gigas]
MCPNEHVRFQDASNMFYRVGDPNTGVSPLTPPNHTVDAFSSSRSFPHIQLVMDRNCKHRWEKDMQIHTPSDSLHLHNNSVVVEQEGLYFFYVQAAPISCKTTKTVTLFRNAVPVRKPVQLKLSEVVVPHNSEHTVSVSKTVSCEKEDSVRLEIHPADCFLWNSDKTYWGFFLLASQPSPGED